jgi:hypothetical protein
MIPVTTRTNRHTYAAIPVPSSGGNTIFICHPICSDTKINADKRLTSCILMSLWNILGLLFFRMIKMGMKTAINPNDNHPIQWFNGYGPSLEPKGIRPR